VSSFCGQCYVTNASIVVIARQQACSACLKSAAAGR
jgi:hypothetical protein